MKKQKQKTIVELMKLYKKSPLLFIRDMWGLKPLRPGEVFVKGKHLTNHQVELLKGVEDALSGVKPRRIAIRSGHGTGKSCSLALLIIWYLFCFVDSQISSTAPSANQMHDVLWKEISIWINKLPEDIKKYFEWSTEYVRITENPNAWFARAKTARKEAPEALAGVHGRFVMFIIDEASGVPEEIFNTAEGALTEQNILIIMASNPTRLVGYFYDSFHKDKANWQNLHFNSIDSPLVDKEYTERIIKKHGALSDEYKIRVLGEFPAEDALDDKGYVPLFNQADIKLIPDMEFIGECKMGVDPSGEGANETVWVVRDRFKAKIAAKEQISNEKSIAQKTLTLMEYYKIKPENVYIDSFGIGSKTIQELYISRAYVKAVNVGEKPEDLERFMNQRAEYLYRLREWLRSGGELIHHEGWEQLLTIRFKRNLRGLIQIMTKDEMRREGYVSPDICDALMLTFSELENQYNIVQQNLPKSFDRFSPV